ncbi:hypothetical protein ABP27_21605 [Salmonella enterica subsp. enterica serovar Agona]|nr:hypothetical protein [Salmonella enterica subsp. enterica serovar Agona]
MKDLIGTNVTMVIAPGMLGVGCATGDIIFTAPYVERDGTANALFLMESTWKNGHKLYTLATANPELVHDQPGGRFENVCLLASSEAGHCAGVAAALRKLAERFDSLELANNKPTKLDA